MPTVPTPNPPGPCHPEPLVSVVMPVYNAGSLLKPVLESISRQTRREFEVILVNDGSTDGSGALLEDWTRKDTRFRVIHHDRNRNVACARNTGIAAARCPLIAHADADDPMHEERLALQLGAFAKQPDLGIVGSWLKLKNGRLLRYPTTTDEIRLRVLWGPPIPQNTAMINRNVTGDFQYDQELEFCEDIALWLKLVFRTTCLNLPYPLAKYTQPNTSLSNNFNARRLEVEQSMMRRRGELLGIDLDIEAGLAMHLGNRHQRVGAQRIGRHARRLCHAATTRIGIRPEVVRRERRFLAVRMWRLYGRGQVLPDLIPLTKATLGLLTPRFDRSVEPRIRHQP